MSDPSLHRIRYCTLAGKHRGLRTRNVMARTQSLQTTRRGGVGSFRACWFRSPIQGLAAVESMRGGVSEVDSGPPLWEIPLTSWSHLRPITRQQQTQAAHQARSTLPDAASPHRASSAAMPVGESSNGRQVYGHTRPRSGNALHGFGQPSLGLSKYLSLIHI